MMLDTVEQSHYHYQTRWRSLLTTQGTLYTHVSVGDQDGDGHENGHDENEKENGVLYSVLAF